MDVFSRHYHQLAGLDSDWAISHVQLDVQWAPKTRHGWARQNQPLEANA
jgi:hypothetical protein